jgi:4-amino-4-deoxy-L-arabinose transferase-like glycosyltransferase
MPQVPFHPDESTYLYMSRDFDLLFRQGNPAAVTWLAPNQPADVIRYRLLDGPLAHYLPGLGRALGGNLPGLRRDWNWSVSWNENSSAGALPSAAQLNAARFPAAMLTALSLLPLYGIGARLGGAAVGVAATGFYALSGLIFLHGQRAMAEGPLLLFALGTIWLLLYAPRMPVLIGLSIALAVNAKLTALALLPVAALALFVNPASAPGVPAQGRRMRWITLLALGASFLVSSLLFNPVLWAAPLEGLAAMARARQELLSSQAAALRVTAPGMVLDRVSQRLLAMLYHVYFAPPAFWDVPNYAAQTRLAELSYLGVPLQAGWHTTSLATNLVTGGVVMGLTLVGIAFGGLKLRAPRSLPPDWRWTGQPATGEQRVALVILAAWTLATVTVLLSINIAWQRYYLPLVPIICLWAGYGLVYLIQPLSPCARRRR